MKKIIVTTMFLASLVACYKEEAILNEVPQDPLTKSKPYLSGDELSKMKRHKITPARAVRIAEEARNLFTDENERLIRTRSVGATLAPVAITTDQPLTRAGGSTDTLLYVVNYNNNDGYVFVSNDDRDGEILMYSGNGNFQMQDTTDNPGLKLHVEMMLAYQKHKLKEIRTAEARGETYWGEMTTDEVPIDDCLPNILTADTKASGMPGMPGHTCNVTGQPGMPGLPGSTPTRYDICAPANYESKDWEGNENAIALAKKKYRNEKCFGVPVNPPVIDFPVLGPPGPGQPCATPPYCNPPIFNYESYYNHYGCWMKMMIKSYINMVEIEILPLVTTYWDQDEPLRLNNGKNFAGCTPIALAQIMMYHQVPTRRYNYFVTGANEYPMLSELRKLKTNTDISQSSYRETAWRFINEIAARLDVTFNNDGSTSTSTSFKLKKPRKALESFGYFIGYDGMWDYYRTQNFWRVVQSIRDHQPVFMSGQRKGGGHSWILDGYKKVINRYSEANYSFDEYGQFTGEHKSTWQATQMEYVHANMGWGTAWENLWVERGVYVFGNNYDKEIYYIAGIKPN